MKAVIKEAYIHYLWKNKLLLVHTLKLKSGEEIAVLNVGVHNENQSGPDFLMASIKINELVWYGHVEIHVNSSDWYQHKHHTDTNYNNVILHLVYNDNKPVKQNGVLLPTVEICHLISDSHYHSYLNYFKYKGTIFCAKKLNPDYLSDYRIQQNIAFQHRINRKSLSSNERPALELFNRLVARVFGGKSNGDVFEGLLEKHRRDTKDNDTHIQKAPGAISKTFIENSFYNERYVSKGHRPQSNVQKRLNEWRIFTELYKIEDEIHLWKNSIQIEESITRLRNKLKSALSSFMIENLILNALLPFIYRYSISNSQDFELNTIIRAYSKLPAENNTITRKWNKMGITLKNAYESQASLEIYQQFCLLKKCASCEVGKNIMKK
jgi:hypothetical protein